MALDSRSTRAATRIVGAVLLVVGALLLVRPLTALLVGAWASAAAMAAVGVLLVKRAPRSRRAWVGAVALGAAATAVALFPAALVRALPFIVAALLVVSAARSARHGLRSRSARERLVDALVVVAGLIGAVLFVLWPDGGLLVTSWAFSVLVLVLGLRLLASGTPAGHAVRRDRRGFGWVRVCGALVALVAAVGAGVGSVWLRADRAAADSFYTWDDPVPARPGSLLRAGPYTGQVPAGADAIRILYTTTHGDGSPALASAVVVSPRVPAGEAALVVAWQHGTTGVAQECAPSLRADAVTDDSIPGISRMVERGWVVVATDYPGQGTGGRYPYLIGEGEGRAVLDGVRAAREVETLDTSDRVMLWGHSQGGHATLWAGQIAQDYAPELDLVGVAALSAASDPLAMAEAVVGLGASALAEAVTSYVVVPYADEYPDVTLSEIVHPAGRLFAETAASRCAVDRDMLVTLLVGHGLRRIDPVYDLDLDSSPLRDRLRDNIADGVVPAPLFLGQGVDDEVVPVSMQQELGARLAGMGRDVEAHTYPGRTHMGVVAPGSPLIDDLFAWADGIELSAARAQ